jgi:hypothetical protein
MRQMPKQQRAAQKGGDGGEDGSGEVAGGQSGDRVIRKVARGETVVFFSGEGAWPLAAARISARYPRASVSG